MINAVNELWSGTDELFRHCSDGLIKRLIPRQGLFDLVQDNMKSVIHFPSGLATLTLVSICWSSSSGAEPATEVSPRVVEEIVQILLGKLKYSFADRRINCKPIMKGEP